MANAKGIYIKGFITFDGKPLNDDGTDKDGIGAKALALLGRFTLPTYGLGIKFTGETKQFDNQFGGKTTLVEYVIQGVEAVSYKGLDAMLDTLKKVGEVTEADTYEIGSEKAVSLL